MFIPGYFWFLLNLNYAIFFCQPGECWAGHSNLHNYARYGSAKSGCIQDDYLPCQKNSRYCMGGRYRNMVYQIVDTSCPQVPFEKVGCFNDFHITSARPLPDYLFNDRDDSIDNYSGDDLTGSTGMYMCLSSPADVQRQPKLRIIHSSACSSMVSENCLRHIDKNCMMNISKVGN